ncbi:TIGR04219 family outer membrane beta-barrel protein [Vibrio metschnikovii]|uniref:TIGR04219 family outer membrane beta-barrel protein n=1 Tax=Vibrio metschnikovii TaxID=28172 RepID=UPI001C3035BE|nr:TIGR04219 family outer membrane beta-barrel protein [Vibrio metschnikovii]
MNRIKTILCGVAVCVSSSALAEEAAYGVKVGAEMWWGKTKIDNVRYDTAQVPVISFAVEHSFDYWPNMSFRYSHVDAQTVTFDKYDYTLYYRLLDRQSLRFNAGVMLSQYRSTDYRAPDNQHYDFNDLTFNWFGYAELSIPNSNVDIIGQIDFGESKGIKSADMTAGIQYVIDNPTYPLSLKAGYRVIDLEFTNLATQSPQTSESLVFVDGWFIGAEMRF